MSTRTTRFPLDLAPMHGYQRNTLMSSIVHSAPREMPQTRNVVATINATCKLNLKDIVTKSRNSEYNPKRFAAVIMRIREPKSTALIFSTGKIVITGAKTEDDAWISARKYIRILQKLDFPAKFTEWKIVNIVACCATGFPIRLDSVSHFQSQCSSYEPELFPGLIYRMKQPKVVILIFVSGKIIVTGAKTKDEIDESWKLIWPILQRFKKHYQDNEYHNNVNNPMDLDQED
eukprot:226822_1